MTVTRSLPVVRLIGPNSLAGVLPAASRSRAVGSRLGGAVGACDLDAAPGALNVDHVDGRRPPIERQTTRVNDQEFT